MLNNQHKNWSWQHNSSSCCCCCCGTDVLHRLPRCHHCLLRLLLHLLQLFPQVIPLLTELPVLLLQCVLPVLLALQQQLEALNAVWCCQPLLLLQRLEARQLYLSVMHLQQAADSRAGEDTRCHVRSPETKTM